MPIQRLLSDEPLEPDDIARLTTAYEAALQLLRLNDRADPVAELVAAKIIAVYPTACTIQPKSAPSQFSNWESQFRTSRLGWGLSETSALFGNSFPFSFSGTFQGDSILAISAAPLNLPHAPSTLPDMATDKLRSEGWQAGQRVCREKS